MKAPGQHGNVLFRHAELVSASRSWFLGLAKNEEQVLALRSSPRTVDRQRWTSFTCSLQPPTRYPRPRPYEALQKPRSRANTSRD